MCTDQLLIVEDYLLDYGLVYTVWRYSMKSI